MGNHWKSQKKSSQLRVGWSFWRHVFRAQGHMTQERIAKRLGQLNLTSVVNHTTIQSIINFVLSTMVIIKFKAFSVEAQWEDLKKYRRGICLNCLQQGNEVKSCPTVKRSKHCSKKHHSWLRTSFSKVISKQIQVTTHLTKCGNYGTVLLPTTIVMILKLCGNYTRVRAFMDQRGRQTYLRMNGDPILNLRCLALSAKDLALYRLKTENNVGLGQVPEEKEGCFQNSTTLHYLTLKTPACLVVIHAKVKESKYPGELLQLKNQFLSRA